MSRTVQAAHTPTAIPAGELLGRFLGHNIIGTGVSVVRKGFKFRELGLSKRQSGIRLGDDGVWGSCWTQGCRSDGCRS